MRPTLLSNTKALEAVNILLKSYPNAHYYLNFRTDIDLMVAAIISAQTRDEVVNAVTPGLFKKYRTVKDYADADEKELAGYIRSVSFAGNKAKNIIKSCKAVMASYGGRIPRTMKELTDLPGIGRKTANTILINAYGIVEGIPVDTWVIKLAYRIGLTRSQDPEDIEQDLMRIVNKEYWKKIAYVFKAHGRAICQSQIPICSRCMLGRICPRNGVMKSR